MDQAKRFMTADCILTYKANRLFFINSGLSDVSRPLQCHYGIMRLTYSRRTITCIAFLF